MFKSFHKIKFYRLYCNIELIKVVESPNSYGKKIHHCIFQVAWMEYYGVSMQDLLNAEKPFWVIWMAFLICVYISKYVFFVSTYHQFLINILIFFFKFFSRNQKLLLRTCEYMLQQEFFNFNKKF